MAAIIKLLGIVIILIGIGLAVIMVTNKDLLPFLSRAASDNAQIVSYTVPPYLAPGQVGKVTVTVKNTGSSIWSGSFKANWWRLGAGAAAGSGNIQTNAYVWSNFKHQGESSAQTFNQRVYTGRSLNPSESYKYEFDIKAPDVPGLHHLSFRMVHDGLGWFGPALDIPIRVSSSYTDRGTPKVVIKDVQFNPTQLQSGQSLKVSVTIKNEGQEPALSDDAYRAGYTFTEGQVVENTAKIGSWRIGVDFDGRSGLFDHPYRWGIGGTLNPGQSRTIDGYIRLQNNGSKNYWVGVVEETLGWHQDFAGKTTVIVGKGQKSMAGVHWYSGDASMLNTSLPVGSRGYNVEAIYGVENMGSRDVARAKAQKARDDGLINIIRVDYKNYQAVPTNSSEYENWANKFIERVRDLSALSTLFIVGNEPNLEGGITGQQYAAAYKFLYSRKWAMPNGTQLLVAGPSGFSDPSWLKAVTDNIDATDGFAIHTYGDPTSCSDPRVRCNRGGWWFDGGFLFFQDQIGQINSKWYSKPIYITEFNTDVNGTAYPNPKHNYQNDWTNKAFEAVRNYNNSRGLKPEIKALIWFVDRDDGGWGDFALRNLGAARNDLTEEFKNSANLRE